jgi:hypothetical protein
MPRQSQSVLRSRRSKGPFEPPTLERPGPLRAPLGERAS